MCPREVKIHLDDGLSSSAASIVGLAGLVATRGVGQWVGFGAVGRAPRGVEPGVGVVTVVEGGRELGFCLNLQDRVVVRDIVAHNLSERTNF
ncbi:hypothetical protein SARC_08777 [Sphaeroforma arctica JP610]|uniref:Uncharacterized protein n=1 Tax=Sphaeroforma arctica JP610 TaxID=667725 RepID=A0A0L0FS53_9EUKA|nr:hypothetical protein SARC_08777 [Sphaeroforma arctica JP610]KNC78808.1 hypothetical protein SARC_08777 [Sphaeroforma arctica JP610]|eukprot:XP_014152710.1 hypothetical protein SARC_08777 [Sphaeroforma arctica JP610]